MKHKIITLIIFLITAISITAAVYAAENPGLVQIDYGYLFEDGSFDAWYSSPGIAIGKTTVLAPDSFSGNLSFPAERKDGYEALGITGEITGTYVVYQKDHLISATLHSITESVAIFQLEEEVLTVSPIAKETPTTLYATGYSSTLMDTKHYAESTDILIQSIETSSIAGNSVSFYSGSSEALVALITKENELYGIVTEQGTAMGAERIKEILTSAGIPYEEGKEKETLNTTELLTTLAEAEAIELSQYSVESAEYLKEAISVGNSVIRKLSLGEDLTQDDVDKAVSDIKEARKALTKPKDATNKIIEYLIYILVGSLVVLGVLLFYLKKHPEQNPFTKKSPVEERTKPGIVADYIIPEGAQETSVLMSDALIQNTAYIIREKTGERKNLIHFPFTIGKDPNAKYRITDNEAISRIHCSIVCMNGDYLIADNDSLNDTYLWDIKLTKQYIVLHEGDEIMVANEKFIFHTGRNA